MAKRSLVLIVEDDIELSDIFSTVLQANGAETLIVRDGNLALERIESMMPDAVILDMHLPNVSGAEILGQIRANPKLANVKVIVATADALLAQMSDKAADLVLLKPVSYMQLTSLVARVSQTQSPTPS